MRQLIKSRGGRRVGGGEFTWVSGVPKNGGKWGVILLPLAPRLPPVVIHFRLHIWLQRSAPAY